MGAKCKGCGKPLVWGRTHEGKKIPLDTVAPTYRVTNEIPDEDGSVSVERTPRVYVSHFSTCPQADLFSGSRKG